MIRLSNKIRNLACDTITKVLAGGNCLLYSGNPPTYPDFPATGVLKATLPFAPKAAFAPAGIDGTPGQADAILQTGTAKAPLYWLTGSVLAGTLGWFRLIGGNGSNVADGVITLADKGGDLSLDSLTVSAGTESLSLFRISVPGSTGPGEDNVSGSGTFQLSNSIRNAIADAITKSITGVGNTPGTIKIYSGLQPDQAEDIATGTLLATLAFGVPAYRNAGLVDIGLAVAESINQVGPVASKGIAGWFRILDGNGDTVMDGSIGMKKFGIGDMLLDTIVVADNAQISLGSFPLSIPMVMSGNAQITFTEKAKTREVFLKI